MSCMHLFALLLYRMWGAATQHFNALLQLDPNNTQARIHRAKAQYNLVCIYDFGNLLYIELNSSL